MPNPSALPYELTLFAQVQEALSPATPKEIAKSTSLFEIDEALSELMDAAVEAAAENNGEIPPELQQAVLDYCEAFGEKVDRFADYVRSQEFVAANAAAEIERLTQRKSDADNRVRRLKDILRFFMQARNTRHLRGRLNTFSLRRNSQDSLLLADPSGLPTEYCRTTTTLNCGEIVEIAAHLPPDHHLRERLEKLAETPKREPDNAAIRTALAAGIAVGGAELKRGEHIRLT